MANHATGIGVTPLIIFRGGAVRTHEIVFAPATNFVGTIDDVYDFVVPNGGSSDAGDYLNVTGSQTYSYSPAQSPIPVAQPNYQGFLADCLNDANAPSFSIALMYCQAFANPTLTPAQLKVLVSKAIPVIQQEYPAQAAAILTAVSGYATANGLALT